MQKQQYTLFLTRDDGATRSIRFCARTLHLLIGLCVGVPVLTLICAYMALQSCQDAAVLSHNNELLREEMQICQQELQKLANIQELITRYEHGASPILMATKAVAGADVIPQESAPNAVVSQNELIHDEPVRVPLLEPVDLESPESNPSAERILQLQTKPQADNLDCFTVVTDNKAKLTDIAIREASGRMHMAFRLANATKDTIAGHIYVAIQGHDKKLYPIRISEKHTAFRIARFRDYALDFALPKGFNAADVDKVVITAKTREGEVFYCNGFVLQ